MGKSISLFCLLNGGGGGRGGVAAFDELAMGGGAKDTESGGTEYVDSIWCKDGGGGGGGGGIAFALGSDGKCGDGGFVGRGGGVTSSCESLCDGFGVSEEESASSIDSTGDGAPCMSSPGAECEDLTESTF